MAEAIDSRLTEAIRSAAHALNGSTSGYDPLFDAIGNARVVLLGEASHGTHEFYHERARITRRLIEENVSEDAAVGALLAGFRHFPQWIWRNTESGGAVRAHAGMGSGGGSGNLSFRAIGRANRPGGYVLCQR